MDPILYLLYGISGTRLIYRDIGDIAVAGLLAGLAGSALLASSKLIAAWPPTRRAGQILQDRILGTAANWRNHPARSATEACSFLGVRAADVRTISAMRSSITTLQAQFRELTDSDLPSDGSDVRLKQLMIINDLRAFSSLSDGRSVRLSPRRQSRCSFRVPSLRPVQPV